MFKIGHLFQLFHSAAGAAAGSAAFVAFTTPHALARLASSLTAASYLLTTINNNSRTQREHVLLKHGLSLCLTKHPTHRMTSLALIFRANWRFSGLILDSVMLVEPPMELRRPDILYVSCAFLKKLGIWRSSTPSEVSISSSTATWAYLYCRLCRAWRHTECGEVRCYGGTKAAETTR